MTDDDIMLLKAVRLAEELEQGEFALWWLSFADTNGFKGVVILEALGFTHALLAAGKLGINPGGEVQGFPVPYDEIPEALRNRLLKKPDLAGFGVSSLTGEKV